MPVPINNVNAVTGGQNSKLSSGIKKDFKKSDPSQINQNPKTSNKNILISNLSNKSNYYLLDILRYNNRC